MRIKILGRERPIAFDGQTVTLCPKGSRHTVSDELAESLIRDKWAVEDDAPAQDVDDAAKAVDGADDNKSAAGPSENK